MSTVITAFEPKYKHPSESILYGFNFGPLLEDGETIVSGTVTCADAGITVGTAAVVTEDYVGDEGQDVFANESLQARVSVGVNGTDYTLTATVLTSDGNTRILICVIKCRTK